MDRMAQCSLVEQAGTGGSAAGRELALLAETGLADPTTHERVARIVRTIEGDIIPRLVRLHREAEGDPLPEAAPARDPTPDDVERLVRGLLRDDEAGCQAVVRDLRESGVLLAAIYLRLLAPAARELGRLWEEDLCLFSDVTVAVGRLQRMMRGLGPEFGRERAPAQDGRRVLLVPVTGEQHTFGLAMVAEFFRRAGWEVTGGYRDPALEPVELVRSEWFDVVGISCSATVHLRTLESQIAAMRQSSRNKGLGILVGGAIFASQPGLARDLGADAAATDGESAPGVAEQLLATRLQRL